MLVKISTVTGDPGTPDVIIPGNPGSPGVSEVPAWDEKVGSRIETYCKRYASSTNPITGVRSTVCVEQGTRTVAVMVHHDAVPAVPPTPPTPPIVIPGRPANLVTDYNFGWNAGAVSKTKIPVSCKLTFQCPVGLVGAVVGLNFTNQGAGYREIPFALYLAGGVAKVVESGVEIGDSISYVEADEFSITRLGSSVSYWKNSEHLYTSKDTCAAPLFVDCSLYSGGDKIL